MNDLERVCNQCERTKSITEFNRDSSRPDGYRGYCKKCQAEYAKKYDPNQRPSRQHLKKKAETPSPTPATAPAPSSPTTPTGKRTSRTSSPSLIDTITEEHEKAGGWIRQKRPRGTRYSDPAVSVIVCSNDLLHALNALDGSDLDTIIIDEKDKPPGHRIVDRLEDVITKVQMMMTRLQKTSLNEQDETSDQDG